MKCQSHKYMLNMFITYNIVSVVLSVALATPFFVSVTGGVRRFLLPWKWKCWKGNEISDDEETTITGFVVSALGSIAIDLSAPLMADNSIMKNHPDGNRWVIIEQWSTWPRATIFCVYCQFDSKLDQRQRQEQLHIYGMFDNSF